MSTGRDPRAAIVQFVDKAYAALDRVDYYRVLGVSSAAPSEEIRAAYYRLATYLHPDVHGEGIDAPFRARLTAVYSRVVEAYKVLSDPGKREKYDSALAGGHMRLARETPVVRDPSEQLTDPSARKFFQLARAALADGDAKAALMNLRLAASVQSDSQLLKDEIAKVEAILGGRG